MLSRWSLLLAGLVAIAGGALACEGLSPGDQIIIPAGSCTLGFLLAAPDGLYFSTAGHCIQVNETVSTPDIGEWGVGAFHYLEPPPTAVPMSGGGPGEDFGLIRILPEFYAQLNPKMCGWEGPTGIYEGDGEGSGVRHYGHGIVFGEAFVADGPMHPREGFNLRTDETAFYWTGLGTNGDSGSAVMTETNLAIGVFTHGQYGATTEDNGGTRLQRGFALAAEAGFTNLRLVLMGEDPLKVLAEMRNAPPPVAVSPVPPTSGAPQGSPPPATNGTAPATGSPAGSSGSATNDSIDPATTDDTVPAAEQGKDTPFPATPVLALALALALALRRSKRQS